METADKGSESEDLGAKTTTTEEIYIITSFLILQIVLRHKEKNYNLKIQFF